MKASNSHLIKFFYLIFILCCFTSPTQAQFGALVKAVKKGYDDTRNTLKRAEKDIRRETGTAIDNTGNELLRAGLNVNREVGVALDNTGREMGRAVSNIQDEALRVGPNTLDFAKAMGKFVERQVSGTAEVLHDANNRIIEGKLADALFHLALDPLKIQEEALFKATQESGWINSAGAITANAYGGPGGAAAYAAWQTYKATNGNAELALRAGFIAGFSSQSMQNINSIETIENFDVVKKAVLAGSVGGLAIGLSGGDESDVLEGFVLAGGMVIIQEGYHNSTGHALDPRAATKDPYCISETINCDPFKEAYYIDENGNPRIDYSKLDPKASYVGEGFNIGETRAPYSWTQDRSPFMQTVAKLPGFNAMGLFHDNWVLSWQMSDIASKATIFPALVLTYYGAGAPLATSIVDATVNSETPTPGQSAEKIVKELILEPSLVLAEPMTEILTPVELNLDKTNIKKVREYHVAQTNLTTIGKYIIIRNIANQKIQRVLITGGLPESIKSSKAGILLSPLTMEALGISERSGVVQTEIEDLILASTVDPPPAEINPDFQMAYLKAEDTLKFPNLDIDEKWELTLMGPGGGEIITNFHNTWKGNLKKGQYMYLLTNTSEGEFPWGYYGFFKVISETTSSRETSGNLNADSNHNQPTSSLEEFVDFNGRTLEVFGETVGNGAMVTAEDESLILLIHNLPSTDSFINADFFTEDCSSCLAIQLTDIDLGVTYIATSGTFIVKGNTIFLNLSLEELASDDKPTNNVVGRFKIVE